MMVKPRHLPVARHASHGVHWSPSQEPGWGLQLEMSSDGERGSVVVQ